MKTREIEEIIEVQDGGCCGPVPEVKTTTQTSCCDGATLAEEKPKASGGCCG